MKMDAVLMTAAGGAEVLEPSHVPIPALSQPDELLIRVHAAGVNPLDAKVRKLHFFYPQNLPVILGAEGAGVVAGVGSGVTRFRVGDEVYFFGNGIGAQPGAYAQYTLIGQDYAARKPAKLSMVEAAAVPLVSITAWEALVDRIVLGSGEKVLIHGGAGGVGHIALQLARVRGAAVAATVSSEQKAQFVRSLGAELAIDYLRDDFVEEALHWTGGRGVDALLDTVGGATFCRSFEAIRLYGRIATILSTACELSDVNKARLRNLTIGLVQTTAPLFLGDVAARRAQTRILEECAALFDENKLKVLVSSVLPLQDAAQAHRMVEEGHTIGKVVLRID